MKNQVFLALCLWASSIVLAETDDSNNEALRLCGNIHHTDIHLMHHPHAAFSNSRCFLHCYDGDHVLSSNAINDGFPCPGNPTAGVCHHGFCVDFLAEALHQCTNLHSTDFAHLNSSGTAFVNDHCALRCAVAGNTLSMNNLNEGGVCDTNLNGVRLIKYPK